MCSFLINTIYLLIIRRRQEREELCKKKAVGSVNLTFNSHPININNRVRVFAIYYYEPSFWNSPRAINKSQTMLLREVRAKDFIASVIKSNFNVCVSV
jgi:hypothetical protein